MQVLRNAWYMIGWTHEVDRGRPLERVVAEERIVVTMGDDGQLTAWSHAGSGRPIAVVPRSRIIWIWFGAAESADPSSIADFGFFDTVKETAFFCGYLPTAANYELLTDNILDLSHADFLHPDTLGGGSTTRNPPRLEREGQYINLTWDAPNDTALPIFDRLLPTPGQPAHVRLDVRWSPPASMCLVAQVSPAEEPLEKWFRSDTAHIMTPETEFTSHYFYGIARTYLEDDRNFTEMQAAALGRAFAEEDKPIIEAQQREMGQSDLMGLNPVLLPTDVGGVQARRALAELMRKEAAAS